MSFFSVGGNAGFALGPVLTTPLVLYFGLPGTLFLALPAVLMGAVLLHEMPRLLSFRPEPSETKGKNGADAPDRWWPFARMVGVVTIRSFVYFGLVTFVGAYYVRELGTSPALANAALSVMLFAGAVGTLLMGPLADRVGRKAVLAGSMLVLAPLIYVFTLTGPFPGMALLALIGAATIGTFGVTVVMGQEYLPGREGLASGITLGLAIGVGGMLATALGAVADVTSVRLALVLLPAFALAALMLAASLPRAAPASTAR
jgi:FSR family fosmidomycin resistance protein-like MFS transporter